MRFSFARFIITSVAILMGLHAQAFSLLGPLAPWMTQEIGYARDGDIGGPMDIGKEYRWNIPTITYGFDQEFVDYFGEAGVRAVEDAIAIINDLPPASEIDLSNYPLEARRYNDWAANLGLIDLKSATLSLLLEQLGLAEPTRYVWTLRYRTATDRATNYVVMHRNYDPETLEPTNSVNGSPYQYRIYEWNNPVMADAEERWDPYSFPFNAVADKRFQPGELFLGLSRDDGGGLRYLLSRTNQNVEPLLSGVENLDGGPPAITTALRGGVEKLTLVRMHFDTNTGAFTALTNFFVDTFITNGVPQSQLLRRVGTLPDILFCARDLGLFFGFHDGRPVSFWPFTVTVTDASSWKNNAALNGDSAASGPGVIAPPITITLNKLGRYSELGSGGSILWPWRPPNWATFDATPIAPIVLGNSEFITSLVVTNRVWSTATNRLFESTVLGITGGVYDIEASTNLVDWFPLITVTNVQEFFTFTDTLAADRRFYRVAKRD